MALGIILKNYMKHKRNFKLNIEDEFIQLKKDFLDSEITTRIVCLLVHGSSISTNWI